MALESGESWNTWLACDDWEYMMDRVGVIIGAHSVNFKEFTLRWGKTLRKYVWAALQ